ncbi:inosine/uridine-preferring nucleoside hydrolase [Thozetella sp. PMI_491]|nr:inosine/uridine-preferring nucleoside hydrolase [Thozetella sp. PMI_491]
MRQPGPIVLSSWLLGSGSLAAAKKNLIIDTDLFSDVDDAGALLLAATSPQVNLLAVNVNYPSTYSALAASAILAHYGHSDVPIGLRRPATNETFLDQFTYELGEYASKVAYHWSGGTLPWGHAEDAWDPVQLYRKTLAAAPNSSVTIASIGFLDNLSALLNSSADSISPLTGPELIAAKVAELVVMGGEYPSGREWNFFGEGSVASAHVVNNWQGRVIYSGSELGGDVLSGGKLMAEGPFNDPVRAGYIYYTYNNSRSSWDPLTLLYAINGLGELFEYGNQLGHNSVAADGSNAWVYDESIRGQHWLKLKVSNEAASEELDRLYLRGAWAAASRGPHPKAKRRGPAHGEL